MFFRMKFGTEKSKKEVYGYVTMATFVDEGKFNFVTEPDLQPSRKKLFGSVGDE